MSDAQCGEKVRYNTLQHTATHCNMLQHMAMCCNTLQHTTLIAVRILMSEAQFGEKIFATHCNTLQHTATHCNTLHHTATHCNTLQRHAATRYNTHERLYVF